ncbi:DUF4381 domain-containing protein [Aeromicrobium sp. 9AM]|uniref:DUF4381 domain-containing protein n=1 Tax=Aeromicrobium sp. 9AM TaxID=2653126 RepID=UPI0012F10A2C|nr:DUF4381 domain-containing protein [Aeromicrobium sp. 9AM]VXB23652.1 conserved hypothetical protein [Aeromicrobium sp. 9AM]
MTTALILVPLAVVAILVLQRVIVRHATHAGTVKRVLADGQPATAVVLDTYDTGNRVSSIFLMVRLDLRIEEAPGVAAFETQTVVPISPVKLADFAVGRTVKVRVDPATKDVAMDQPVR